MLEKCHKVKNKNAIGLMAVCLINNILYMFMNTFMVAYFITLTNYDYKLISIYYILSSIGTLLTFIIFGSFVKNKNKVCIFRSGIILYCVYILMIALMKEKIVDYYMILGLFYGIVQGLFWAPGNTLINENTKNIENSFVSLKSILSELLKIFFPIIFGASIQLTSFSNIAKIVILLSLLQFSFSLLITDNTKKYNKKYDLRGYINYIKDNKKFRFAYKTSACDGIVHYLLDTIIVILIVMTFKKMLSLGIITTICSICSILSVYLFQYKLKSNKSILKICGIAMVISILMLLISINKVTIVIYNLCYSVFLVLLMRTAETKSYDVINDEKKILKDYVVEHQVTWQIVLNISRILGYVILFIASLFDSMNVFKILLLVVTLVIIFYCKFMVNLDNSK